MEDFVPDDMDEYVRRAQRVESLIGVTDDETVEAGTVALAEWTVFVAEAMVETGRLGPIEAVAATTSIVAGVLAAWYSEQEAEDE